MEGTIVCRHLSFGLRTPPFVFNHQPIHYLHDFLLIVDSDPEFFGELPSCLDLFEKFGKREDGLRVNFLADTMDARLPKEK